MRILVNVNELLKITSLTQQKSKNKMHLKGREILKWQTKNSEIDEEKMKTRISSKSFLLMKSF